MKQLISIALITLTFISAQAIYAQSSVDDTQVDTQKALPEFNLRDQFDRPLQLSESARYLIVAKSKASSDWMGAWLEKQAPNFLFEHQAFYLADIHKMPKMITRLVALPKMKKLPYPIYLGRTSEDLAMFNVQDGCVLLVTVNAQLITDEVSVCDADGVERAMYRH